MSPARKLRIYTRDKGLCEACGGPVALTDCDIDHKQPFWFRRNDTDANLITLHRERADCAVGGHREKTKTDKGWIAKTKRQSKLRLDVPREPPRKVIPSRTDWPKGRKMQSKGFGK